MNKKDNSIITLHDLKKAGSIIRKNWWIVLLFPALAFFIAYIYVYKLTDIYEAKTQILLKSNDKINSASLISDDAGSYFGGYRNFVDNSNEIRILTSYDLIAKTINKLNFDASYFIVGRLKTTEMFDGLPFTVIVATINPDLYEQLIKFKVINTEKYQLIYKKGEEDIVKEGFFNRELIDPDFKINVKNLGAINSTSLDNVSKVEYLIQFHQRDNLVANYKSSLLVENVEYTNVLELKLRDVLPQRATMFLDTLAQVYIDNTIKARFDLNANTLYYIDKQMSDVTSILSHIEDTMQNYKESKAILDLDREGSEYFAKMSAYDGQKTTLKLQIASLDDLERYIIEGKDPEFLPPSIYIVSGDEFLKKSATELYSLQMTRNDALQASTPTSPAIKEVERKIEVLKKNLLTYITNSRKATLEKIADVEKEIQGYIGNIQTLPNKQRGLINIQRKLKVNEDMYLFLLQKKANTVIAKASIMPETKVIETARSMGVVEPNRSKIMYSFILVGMAIAFLIILVRTLFFEKVESFEDLRLATDLPIIGEVLFSPDVEEFAIAVDTNPKSAIAESFRTIRTNLQYISIPQYGSKVIVITSNNPGEGKTFCAINLATMLAKAAKKVLLLELDLHKPRVQKVLKMDSMIGITTIIVGKNSIEECIKPTIIENLDVILSGPIPPNPSELVLSPQLQDIINYGKMHYDYVIVDTPPIGLISDALVLMKFADINLFVLNTKFATRAAITNIQDMVAFNKVNNFALILNGVKRRKSKYYYNRYGYGYGYGYGVYGQSKNT